MRRYFTTRLNKPMGWTFLTGQSRYGDVFRREYAIVPTGFDGGSLVATVAYHDYDAAAKRTTRVPEPCGTVRVPLAVASAPMAILEACAQAADPAFFQRYGHILEAQRQPPGDQLPDALEERIRALNDPANRDDGVPTPKEGSVARFRRFWADNPRLREPWLIAAQNGMLNAQWRDGRDKLMSVLFQEEGQQINWMVRLPKDGPGFRKMSGRSDDADVVFFAERLGISVRSPG